MLENKNIRHNLEFRHEFQTKDSLVPSRLKEYERDKSEQTHE